MGFVNNHYLYIVFALTKLSKKHYIHTIYGFNAHMGNCGEFVRVIYGDSTYKRYLFFYYCTKIRANCCELCRKALENVSGYRTRKM